MTSEDLKKAQHALDELQAITTQLSWIVLSCKHDAPATLHRVSYVHADVWIPIGILRRYIYRAYLKRLEEVRKFGVTAPELSKELREELVKQNVVYELQGNYASLRMAHAIQRFRNIKELERCVKLRANSHYTELCEAWRNYIDVHPYAEMPEHQLALPLGKFDYELAERVIP